MSSGGGMGQGPHNVDCVTALNSIQWPVGNVKQYYINTL